VGTATQTLATQEQAARARTDQTMRAMEFVDKLGGGPEARTLAKQKELDVFRSTLDTPERRIAKEKQALDERQQNFYEKFRNRWLDIMAAKTSPDEKTKTTALKNMQALAKEIQKADAKGNPVAPEILDAYALSAVGSGNGKMQMTYAPEHGWFTGALHTITGGMFESKPVTVTAYEWGLLRELELERPDLDFDARITALTAVRKKQGGALSGPAKSKPATK
jgi:hypothetical protein